MTTVIKTIGSIKKTGYDDIDHILFEAHKLIEEGIELQKDIEVAVKFKPKNPFNSGRKNRKFKFGIKK